MNTFTKRVGEREDFGCDWNRSAAPSSPAGSGDLAPGEIITSSTWSVTPAGLTIETTIFDDTRTTVWVSGGRDDEDYELINTVTTSGGRTYERVLWLKVRGAPAPIG